MSTNGSVSFGACLREARLQAGYATRELSQTYLPISNTVQGRHERDEKRPAVEDVMAYVQAYNAPQLYMHFCRISCPIGCRTMRAVRLRPVSSLQTRLANRLRAIACMADRLAEIADDDVIDDTERADFDRIVQLLEELHDLADDYALFWQQIKAAPRCERKNGSVQSRLGDYSTNYKAI